MDRYFHSFQIRQLFERLRTVRFIEHNRAQDLLFFKRCPRFDAMRILPTKISRTKTGSRTYAAACFSILSICTKGLLHRINGSQRSSTIEKPHEDPS